MSKNSSPGYADGTSFTNENSGTLYICGTPIGNLKDTSFRLIEVLNQVDFIICEDTRRTLKLLSYYEIRKPLVPFYEHVEKQRTDMVISQLSDGKSVALVSDAGMPVISDPGAYLVNKTRQYGFSIESVPGPSSVTTALALSGFYSSQFIFAGFPPRKPGKRRRFFEEWIKPEVPTVFFESPYRVTNFLKDLVAVFPSIQVSLCHEMTKLHEGVITGKASDVYQELKNKKIKGEWVVVTYLDSECTQEEAD